MVLKDWEKYPNGVYERKKYRFRSAVSEKKGTDAKRDVYKRVILKA